MRKKILAATVLGGALLSGSLQGTGQANATLDPGDQFASDAHAQGFYSSKGDIDLITNGGRVCVRFSYAAPSTAEEELYRIWHGSDMTQQQAIQFIKLAVKDLCPEYTSKTQQAFG